MWVDWLIEWIFNILLIIIKNSRRVSRFSFDIWHLDSFIEMNESMRAFGALTSFNDPIASMVFQSMILDLDWIFLLGICNGYFSVLFLFQFFESRCGGGGDGVPTGRVLS